MVFEVLGESLMGLLTPDSYLDRGVPIDIVKQVAKQVLLGLDYMHRSAGLIHTDLKPENVLICVSDVERAIHIDLKRNPPERAPTATKMIRGRSHSEAARLREICITASQPLPSPKGARSLDYFGQHPQSVDAAIDQLSMLSLSPSPRTPGSDRHIGPLHIPVLSALNEKLASPIDDPRLALPDLASRVTVKIADIGNSTPIEKHYSDDIQTRQYRSPEVIMGAKWGPSVDLWSLACILFELLTGGDILFQPQGTPEYTKDDDHLAQIYELCGGYPPHMVRDAYYAKHFFKGSRGELRNIPLNRLRPWPLEDVLRDKYLFSKRRAREIADFLTPMLRVDPLERASAQEMLEHPWVSGITVQGEIDAALRHTEAMSRVQVDQLPHSPVEGPVSALSVQTATANQAQSTANGHAKKKKKKR